MPEAGGYRLLEHTADIGLEIWGRSLNIFFEQAGEGLRDILFGPVSGTPEICRRIEVSGQDSGQLLVNWLNEFLFLWETENLIPVEINVIEASPDHMVAWVGGIFFDPARHGIEREIKAATYHQLQVKEENGEWRGRIFLDL